VLYLFQLAFQRRQTFTVGFSVTLGKENCIVWNGIHHKTQTGGGATNYGFPDATYLSRVKEELASKGVVFENEQTRQNCVNLLVPYISLP
jgi:deltex-like protein